MPTQILQKCKHKFWCKSIMLQASRFFLNPRLSSTIRLLHKSLGNKACCNVPSYFPSLCCPLKAQLNQNSLKLSSLDTADNIQRKRCGAQMYEEHLMPIERSEAPSVNRATYFSGLVPGERFFSAHFHSFRNGGKHLKKNHIIL